MQKLLAVVARAVNYRDHDRILTLITREKGTVTATARGCRKPQSKLLAAVQPFTYGEYVFNERNGRLYVSQCDIKESFYDLRLRPEVLQYAAYITVLAEEFSNPEEENKELFSLLLHCLKYLCDEGNEPEGVAAFFIAKLMLFSGYSPEVGICVECGRDEDLVFFSSDAGGAVCRDCGRKLTGVRSISPEALRLIDNLAGVPNAAYLQARDYIEAGVGQVFPVLMRYAADRTERKLPDLSKKLS